MSAYMDSIQAQRVRIEKGKASWQELASEYKNRIDKFNSDLNAIVHEPEEYSSTRADTPLAGIPFSIKDLFSVEGQPTSTASKILENYISPYHSTVAERLIVSGAVYQGKNNQDEFAMGSRNQYSRFGECSNPHSLEHSPGGSSGGSAAAVAAGLSSFSIGSDTGGSVRQPAHFCGVVGVKPTYGRVSRHGMISFASSLDQAGVLARSVDDAATVLECISGHDPRDATTSSQSVPNWSSEAMTEPSKLRVGFCETSMGGDLNPEVLAAMKKVCGQLGTEGAEIVPVDLSLVDHAVSIYYLIAASEASSNLARYDGVRYGHRHDFSKQDPADLDEFYCKTRSESFGSEVKRRIVMGSYFLSAGYQSEFYLRASKVRRKLRDQFLEAFKSCDIILSPVTNSCAPRKDQGKQSPLEQYMDDRFTVPASLAGLPAMSVPYSRFSNHLPMGIQLTASPFDESTLFKVGRLIESLADFGGLDYGA